MHRYSFCCHWKCSEPNEWMHGGVRSKSAHRSLFMSSSIDAHFWSFRGHRIARQRCQIQDWVLIDKTDFEHSTMRKFSSGRITSALTKLNRQRTIELHWDSWISVINKEILFSLIGWDADCIETWLATHLSRREHFILAPFPFRFCVCVCVCVCQDWTLCFLFLSLVLSLFLHQLIDHSIALLSLVITFVPFSRWMNVQGNRPIAVAPLIHIYSTRYSSMSHVQLKMDVKNRLSKKKVGDAWRQSRKTLSFSRFLSPSSSSSSPSFAITRHWSGKALGFLACYSDVGLNVAVLVRPVIQTNVSIGLSLQTTKIFAMRWNRTICCLFLDLETCLCTTAKRDSLYDDLSITWNKHDERKPIERYGLARTGKLIERSSHCLGPIRFVLMKTFSCDLDRQFLIPHQTHVRALWWITDWEGELTWTNESLPLRTALSRSFGEVFCSWRETTMMSISSELIAVSLPVSCHCSSPSLIKSINRILDGICVYLDKPRRLVRHANTDDSDRDDDLSITEKLRRASSQSPANIPMLAVVSFHPDAKGLQKKQIEIQRGLTHFLLEV